MSSIALRPIPDKPGPLSVRGRLTPAEMARLIGCSKETVRLELVGSRRNTANQIVEGRWQGAFRSLTGRWIIPGEVADRVLEEARVTPGMLARQDERLDALEARVRALEMEALLTEHDLAPIGVAS